MKFRLLLILIVLLPVMAVADGLTLYSYEDDEGQLIVVDSLERIPEQFREGARRNFIPSFSSSGRKQQQKAREAQPEVIVIPDAVEPVGESDELEVLAPPPEQQQPDPAIATATLILADINRIIDHNGQLYRLALNNSPRHPAVRHLHLTSILALRNIIDPRSLTWKKPQQWSDEAARVIEDLRTVQYSVSKWLDSGSGALLSTLPTLIEASRRQAATLTASLAAISAQDSAPPRGR